MTRSRFNLDLASLDEGGTVCIHASYGAGKTHLLGDALRTERTNGPVAYVNFAGEDGYKSIAGMGLGEIGHTITNIAEWKELAAEFTKTGMQCVALDSVRAFAALNMRALVGDRMPQGGDSKANEWGDVHYKMANLVAALRPIAHFVLLACPSDKYTDPVTGGIAMINPDLPGKESRDSWGWFDFLGYLSHEITGPGRIKRTVTFAPNPKIATRVRAPRPVLGDIPIPEGGGGWTNIKAALQGAFTREAK